MRCDQAARHGNDDVAAGPQYWGCRLGQTPAEARLQGPVGMGRATLASSRICSDCGLKLKVLPLSTRVAGPDCAACTADTRTPPAKQEPEL